MALGLQAFAEGFNVLDELATKVSTLQGNIQNLLNITGDDLTETTSRISALAATFNVDENELLTSVNALTENLTGDLSESLDLIETGFLSGANQSGELLDIIREYPTFFEEAGLSGANFISVIDQSVDQGIFNDKGIDLIKEANLSLRQISPTTQAALEGIGLTGEEIQRVIGEDGVGAAITLIQDRLSGFADNSREVGAILADVFRGAGEDAGIGFIRSIDLTVQSTDNLVDATNPLVAAQQRQLDLQEDLTNAQQELVAAVGPFITQSKELATEVLTALIQGLAQFFTFIREIPQFVRDFGFEIAAVAAAFIGYQRAVILSRIATAAWAAVSTGAAGVTGVLRGAVLALNTAFAANPIGFVVLAITALVAAFRVAYDRSQQFRASIDGLGRVAQEVFKIIGETATAFFEGFQAVADGRFQDAVSSFGTVLNNANPISFAFTQGGRLAGAFNEGYTESLEKSRAEGEAEQALLSGLAETADAAKDAGEDVGENFGEGVNEGVNRTLKDLETRKKEIESALKITDPESPEFTNLTTELRGVEREIKAITDRISNNTTITPQALDTGPVEGSIEFLRGELRELEQELATGAFADDNALRDKVQEVVDKSTELEQAEARIKLLRDELSGEVTQAPLENSIEALRKRLSELNKELAATDATDEDAISKVLTNIVATSEQLDTAQQRIDDLQESLERRNLSGGELAAESNIDEAERRRQEQLTILAQANLDEEAAQEQRKRINLLADQEILENRLFLAEQGSLQQLEIARELAETEAELQKLNAEETQQFRLEQLSQYATEALSIIGDLSDAFFEIEFDRLERETTAQLQALQDQTESRLDGVEEGSLEEERILAEQLQAEENLQRAAFQEEKRLRIQQAEINTALAIGNALATTQPFIPAGLAAAALAAVRGAIEVSKIRAQSFAVGGFTGLGFGAPDRSGHKVAGVVHANEYVIPKSVLATPEGRKAALLSERMRARHGLVSASNVHRRGFVDGGFTSGRISVPMSTQIAGGSNGNISVQISEESVAQIADNVRAGAEAGTRKGSGEGLNDGLRTRERQDALSNQIND